MIIHFTVKASHDESLNSPLLFHGSLLNIWEGVEMAHVFSLNISFNKTLYFAYQNINYVNCVPINFKVSYCAF